MCSRGRVGEVKDTGVGSTDDKNQKEGDKLCVRNKDKELLAPVPAEMKKRRVRIQARAEGHVRVGVHLCFDDSFL